MFGSNGRRRFFQTDGAGEDDEQRTEKGRIERTSSGKQRTETGEAEAETLKELALKKLLPKAIDCGIRTEDFYHMTLKSVRMEIEGFWNRRKNEWELAEYQAWVSGAYNLRAIASAFSRNAKYPGNPMQEESINVEELTDDELAGIQEQYLLSLDRMAKRATGQADD